MKFQIINVLVLCLIYKSGSTADKLISNDEIEEGQHTYYFNKELVNKTNIKNFSNNFTQFNH